MLFLEAENDIIRQALIKAFSPSQEGKDGKKKREGIDIKGQEFDGCNYEVTTKSENKEILQISMFVNCGEICIKKGMKEILKRVYGDIVLDKAVEGFTATLEINRDVVEKDQKLREKYIKDVPCLKRYIMLAPFEKAFDAFLDKKPIETVVLPYREEESIYILSFETSLIISFSIKFTDPDDIILARIFLQEFKDARKDISLSNAPPVAFSQGEKPLEFKGVKSREPDDKKLLKDFGFVTLTIFPRHVEKEQRIETLDKLLSFRNYFHYHLKCSKCYMHIRMRDRTANFMKVLEACKDLSGKEKIMKTAAGKTFELQSP